MTDSTDGALGEQKNSLYVVIAHIRRQSKDCDIEPEQRYGGNNGARRISARNQNGKGVAVYSLVLNETIGSRTVRVHALDVLSALGVVGREADPLVLCDVMGSRIRA